MFKKSLTALAAFALATAAFGYESSGGRVRDAAGNPIQLRGVNWYGFELGINTIEGLWGVRWKDQIDLMKSQGFNAVRMPFCPNSLRGVQTGWINPALNPELVGLNSVQIMDKVIKELSNQGFYILLDHHTPDCDKISELWYTANYSEAQWLADLELAANLFSGYPGVIGIDLKNEPHGAATWGTGNVATDWNLAAERGAARVLKAAPHWLIFVEGVNENPNCSSAWGHFWGGNLEPLKCKPLNIPANKLVLAPHVYGYDVYVQSYLTDPTYPANMPAIWDKHFGQYVDAGYTVVMGEFGGKYGAGDVRDKGWQDAFVKYLGSKGMTSSFYWAWNPTSWDTGGILNDDWKSVRTDKMSLLKTLWGSQPATAPAPAPAPAPTAAAFAAPAPAPVAAPVAAPVSAPSPAPAPAPAPVVAVTTSSFTAVQQASYDGPSSFCRNVTVKNVGSAAGNWSVKFDIPGTLTNSSGASSQQQGSTVTLSGIWPTATLQPGASFDFSYCANKTATAAAPAPAPAPAPVAGSSAQYVATAIRATYDGPGSYCRNVTVKNAGGTAGQWGIAMDVAGTITGSVNAKANQQGATAVITGVWPSATLGAGASMSFDYCANR